MKQITKYLLLAITIVLLNNNTFAQNKTIDSLKLALKNAKHDTTRCVILNELSENASDEEWPFFNEQLLKLTERKVAIKTDIHSDFFYLKYYAIALSNLAYFSDQKGDVTKSLEYYYKSLKIYEEIKDEEGIANSFSNIAYHYAVQGNISKALKYNQISLTIREQIQDKIGIAASLNNIGGIYNSQGEISKALEYYKRSLNIQKGLNDKNITASTLNNIGIIYNDLGDIPQAIDCYFKSLKIQEEINDKQGIAKTLNNIGTIYRDKEDFSKALEYFDKSIKIKEEIQDKEGIALTLNNIACLLIKKGQTNKAIGYANRSFLIAKELGYPGSIKNSARTLKEMYQKQNKYKDAFEMYQLEIKMRDSINNDNTRKETIRHNLQYEYDQKETILKAEQEKKDIIAKEKLAQKAQERNYFIIGFILLLIIALFIFRNYRQKQKIRTTKKISEVELKALRAQMNPHFVFNSLNTIQSFIMNKNNQSAMFYLGSFSSLLRMILQNSFKKLISLEQEIKFLKQYSDLEKMRFDNKFQVNITSSELLETIDVQVPPMIIQPIVENAFKHGLMHKPEGGVLTITFDCSPEEDQLICVVEDNGVGRVKSQSIESWRPEGYQSKGIEITESRIEMLNLNRTNNFYSIQVFDLYDTNNNGCGTKVEIKFPLN